MLVLLICSLMLATYTAATSVSPDDCPSGLTKDKYLQVFGDSCFRFEIFQRRPYLEAVKQCEQDGGTLALVKSKDIEAFIVSHMLNSYHSTARVWIGLNDRADRNTFVWADGTRLGNGYSNWDENQGPRLGVISPELEDCVALDPAHEGKWYDYECAHKLSSFRHQNAFVCQYKVQATPTKTLG